MNRTYLFHRFLHHPHRRVWIYFLTAIFTLGLALVAALASQVAARREDVFLAALLALFSLVLAGIIAATVVPYLARRVRLERFPFKISYRITREGYIFFAATILVGLSAANTGNNLLFIILSAMLASILISGVASGIVLRGLQVHFALPEQIFAQQPIQASLYLKNGKYFWPALSISVEPHVAKGSKVLRFERRYFARVRAQQTEQQPIEIFFPRRGDYTTATLNISTRFPFGFITKSYAITQERELIVFPSQQPPDPFFEILPLISGEFESFNKGRGCDLYALRDYQTTDSARHIDWKATARSESVKMREYAREDERRLQLIFDPCRGRRHATPEQFEKAVQICACLAAHFYSEGAQLGYRDGPTERIEGGEESTLDRIFTRLALIEPRETADGFSNWLDRDVDHEKDSFKIIFTSSLEHGTVPTQLWQSSHVIFINEL